MRSFSPSTTRTCTRTVSPALKTGMLALRLSSSSKSRIFMAYPSAQHRLAVWHLEFPREGPDRPRRASRAAAALDDVRAYAAEPPGGASAKSVDDALRATRRAPLAHEPRVAEYTAGPPRGTRQMSHQRRTPRCPAP